MSYIKFDPRVFISPPYVTCPKCGKEKYGVLMICGKHYTRRCENCLHPPGGELETFKLPKLNKKIIYLDQFAISNMMKILNPKTKAHQKGSMDEYWKTLFEMLDQLTKMQLIICPDSHIHTNESLTSSFYAALKRMYELLGHGVSFEHFETIQRFQFCEHARNWIKGKGGEEPILGISSVVNGDVNAWQDRLIISANLNYDDSHIAELRTSRSRVCDGLKEVFARWQTEKGRKFDDWYEEEIMSFGPVILQAFNNTQIKMRKIMRGEQIPTVNDFLPTSSVILIRSLIDMFTREGLNESEVLSKVAEYLTSPDLKNVTHHKISSLLYAALARKAASGQKNPPSQGMVNDISTISTLLPYCDAMFIDNECCSYLNENPIRDRLSYGTKCFSQNTKEDFLNYLKEIKASASSDHINALNEVYGEHYYTEPYTTLYTDS